jgi:hypothetical protein
MTCLLEGDKWIYVCDQAQRGVVWHRRLILITIIIDFLATLESAD